jgi:hypothetical protein
MVALLVLSAALAQEPAVPADPAPGVTFAWAVPQGGTLGVVQETTTSVQTPLGPQSTHFVVTSEHAVTKPGTLGADPVAWSEKVVRQQVDIDMAGEKVAWSSDAKDDEGEPKAPPGGFEALPLLGSSTWTVEIAPDLTAKVTGALAADTAAKAHGAGLSDETVARLIGDEGLAGALVGQLGSLPRGAMAVGESRTSPLELDVPGVGKVAAQHTLKLDRVEAGKAVLVETVSAPDAFGKTMSLKGLKGTGELTWDVAAGRPVSRTLDLGFELVVASGEEEPFVLPTRVQSAARVEIR